MVRKASIAVVLFCSLLVNANAQTRTEYVCVSESEGDCDAGNPVGGKPPDFPNHTVYYACHQGGEPGGYKPIFVCQNLCGAAPGPKCGQFTKPVWGREGGQCGARWVIVTCYK